MLKSVLAAVLVLGTVSATLASEFDPNLENRYPTAKPVAEYALTSKNVSLDGRNVANSSWMDRASRSFDGGGY